MLIRRKKLIMTAVMGAAAVFMLVTQIGASNTAKGAYKLEGAWIAKVTSIDEPMPLLPYQWSYVLAPDASGRGATLLASVDVGFPTELPDGSGLHVFGEMVMTGPDTFAFNSYFYEIEKGVPTAQIVGIGRSYGEGRFTGPGKAEFTHHFEIYLPDADADGDGLPDPGSAPVLTFNATTSDTRIPSPLLK
jgi:hypothetical protein